MRDDDLREMNEEIERVCGKQPQDAWTFAMQVLGATVGAGFLTLLVLITISSSSIRDGGDAVGWAGIFAGIGAYVMRTLQINKRYKIKREIEKIYEERYMQPTPHGVDDFNKP
jgi:hypothetical protein